MSHGSHGSHVDRLTKAGLIHPDLLSAEQKHHLEHKLSDHDIDELIRLGHKLAPAFNDITSPAPR